MGFTESPDGYWWKKINSDTRVCMGLRVKSYFMPGTRTGGWDFQSAKLNEEPYFGMSGNTSMGAEWGTYEKVMDCLLEKIYSIGISRGVGHGNEKVEKIKRNMREMMETFY